jgi:hypothetical protein
VVAAAGTDQHFEFIELIWRKTYKTLLKDMGTSKKIESPSFSSKKHHDKHILENQISDDSFFRPHKKFINHKTLELFHNEFKQTVLLLLLFASEIN